MPTRCARARARRLLATPEEGAWQEAAELGVVDVRRHPAAVGEVHGSWQHVQHLNRPGLVDAYRVLVFPLVLGDGKRLFDDGTPPTAFEVAGSRTTARGTTCLVLRPSGAPAVGSFDVDDGAETTSLG